MENRLIPRKYIKLLNIKMCKYFLKIVHENILALNLFLNFYQVFFKVNWYILLGGIVEKISYIVMHTLIGNLFLKFDHNMEDDRRENEEKSVNNN